MAKIYRVREGKSLTLNGNIVEAGEMVKGSELVQAERLLRNGVIEDTGTEDADPDPPGTAGHRASDDRVEELHAQLLDARAENEALRKRVEELEGLLTDPPAPSGLGAFDAVTPAPPDDDEPPSMFDEPLPESEPKGKGKGKK